MIDLALEREAQYTRSRQTTTEAENLFRETLALNTLDGEIPDFTGAEAKKLRNNFNSKIKTQVTKSTRSSAQEKLKSHVSSLQVQGPLLTIASQEKEDLLWKSSMFQLKSGTLKFMINSSIDTLPTPARWK